MTANKTLAVALCPDGSCFVIRREMGAYGYSSRAEANRIKRIKQDVEAQGGKIVYELNPNYRPKCLFGEL